MLRRTPKAPPGSTATIERAGPSATPAGTDPAVTAIVVVAPPVSVAVPQPDQRHWWSGVVTVAGHRMTVISVIHLPAHHHVERRTYPRRYTYFDNACLSREMRRL